MALFFFISAYLLVGSFDRKGRAKFLKDRLVRIGIPLVGSAVLWFIVLAAAGIGYLFAGWLWFLIYLLILDVAYSIWRYPIAVQSLETTEPISYFRLLT
jgi:fucose 4-O-acetylase-like acetyltransferase